LTFGDIDTLKTDVTTLMADIKTFSNLGDILPLIKKIMGTIVGSFKDLPKSMA